MFSNDASHAIVAMPDVLVFVGALRHDVSPGSIAARANKVRVILLCFTFCYVRYGMTLFIRNRQYFGLVRKIVGIRAIFRTL